MALWVAEDREMLTRVHVYNLDGAKIVVGANTIVEVSHAKVNVPRLRWVLSRVRVEPVTESAATAAANLLKKAGLHGHKYAIDATVAEMALRQTGPVAMLTSDVDDMRRLCGDRVHLIPV
ncbi:DNA-binding protein [Nocardia sp. NPDC127579]|uniref:DNA-binding protein n=1 Tax=Nocardia sp. NPDC127579 TaxID=3345402 RepID=UPI003645231D